MHPLHFLALDISIFTNVQTCLHDKMDVIPAVIYDGEFEGEVVVATVAADNP